MVDLKDITPTLLSTIKFVQQSLRASLEEEDVLDVGFVGDTSGIYPWEPALMMDIDVCIFVRQRSCALGAWLQRTEKAIFTTLSRKGINFVLRVVRGPYKPVTAKLHRPVAFAHVATFTEAEYLKSPSLLRWSWRKYHCLADGERFARMASAPPAPAEVKETAHRKLRRITAGRIEMTAWKLPHFSREVLMFDAADPEFTEYCFAAGATIARSHARALRFEEADALPNSEFFAWYHQQLYDSKELAELMALKSSARSEGSAGMEFRSRKLVKEYLRGVTGQLRRT